MIMKKIILVTVVAVFFVILNSCSSMNQVVINRFAPVLSGSLPEVETEGNFDYFVKTTPSQLKIVEILLYNSPTNLDLLYTLTKSYAAYAFLGGETLLLDKQNQNREKQTRYVTYLYNKALHYGDRYFKAKGTSYEDLLGKQDSSEELHSLLDKYFEKSIEQDREIIFFFAQALGGLINLNKDRPLFTIQLPLVKLMMDYVCQDYPDFYNGGCPTFYGQYDVSRPELLGGNHERGRKTFLKGIEEYPDNLLLALVYLEKYLIPKGDTKHISIYMKDLEDKIKSFRKKNQWLPFYQKTDTSNYNNRLNLFNTVAEKRLEILKRR